MATTTDSAAHQAHSEPSVPDVPLGKEALAAASALVEQGRVFEAVDLLTEANRRKPAGGIERRLVQLRHQAFAHLTPRPGREVWPPRFDDVFGHLDAPPEVDAGDLTTTTLGAGIQNHGCLLVRNFVPPAVATELREGAEQAFEAQAARHDGVPVTETAPWYAPINPGPEYPLTFGERWWIKDGGGVWTADSPRMFFRLLEVFRTVGLGDVLAGYMGERPALSVKKCTLRRVPVDTGTDWHQDGSFLGQGIRTVNVWLALSDCGVDAPGLDVVPKRFDEVLPTGTDGAKFDWSVGPGMVERVSADAPVVRPTFAAGDALLFDEVFLHRTGVSPDMTKERFAIETWFFAPSTYPHSQIPISF
ncbi:MAG: phytanoyl-CoA dioxygenase family protein [Acidimicrobiia bacterium]|nr:phytanoyl-CoA dioxygenase family protein [Acidimicrobiia bacterium]